MKKGPVSSPKAAPQVQSASPASHGKENRFFSKAAKEPVAPAVAGGVADESSKLRVSITIHDLVGLRVPQGGLFKNTKLYWSVRLLSASGATNQRSSSSLVSISDSVNDSISFEESFTFNLEFEGQVMQLALKLSFL